MTKNGKQFFSRFGISFGGVTGTRDSLCSVVFKLCRTLRGFTLSQERYITDLREIGISSCRKREPQASTTEKERSQTEGLVRSLELVRATDWTPSSRSRRDSFVRSEP